MADKTMVGRNVEVEEKGGKLIITVDTGKDLGMSKSGKTKIVATTGGTAKYGELMLNINVNKKP